MHFLLYTCVLQRVSIKQIKLHPWFLKNLPRELTETHQAIYYRRENSTFSLQSVEEIMKIVEEAKKPSPVARSVGAFGWGAEEDGDEKEEAPNKGEDKGEWEKGEEDEYEKTVKEVQAWKI